MFVHNDRQLRYAYQKNAHLQQYPDNYRDPLFSISHALLAAILKQTSVAIGICTVGLASIWSDDISKNDGRGLIFNLKIYGSADCAY